MARGQPPPSLVESGLRYTVGGNVPHRHAGELFQPEIGAGVKMPDVHVLLDERDERQEQRPIETFLVKFGRRHVRCRDYYQPKLEQALEQSAEYHCIGNIGDMKLI